MLESKCPIFSFVCFRQIPFLGGDRKIAAPGGVGGKEGTARKKFCGGIEGTTTEGRVGRGSRRPKEKEEETRWLVGPAEMEINSPISLRAFL